MNRSIKELVKERVHFHFYREGVLNYVTDSGFHFPVPIDDTGTGSFLAHDEGMYFMRWIRRQLEVQKKWKYIDND